MCLQLKGGNTDQLQAQYTKKVILYLQKFLGCVKPLHF